MWKDRQQLKPHRAWEMAATCFTGTVIAVVIVIAVASMAHARWRPEYAQNTQQVRDWFSSQQLNPATKQRLGVPWNGCCENGDVFKTQFRVSKSTGGDEWYYLKGDTWKKVPDDVIHWGQHSPDKRATLFIYVATGQELCFYPPEEGIQPVRCHQCGDGFGLIRHQLLTFSGYLHFCSKKCLNAYKSELRKKIAKQRFLGWLSGQS